MKASFSCLVAVATVLLASAAAIGPVQAVSCPGSGAGFDVDIYHPEAIPGGSVSVTISGCSISGEVTGANKSSSYSQSVTVSDSDPNPKTVTVPRSGGLNSGMWKHRIYVSSTTQEQYQQQPSASASAQYFTEQP